MSSATKPSPMKNAPAKPGKRPPPKPGKKGC